MSYMCYVCKNCDAEHSKRLIESWHYSPKLQITYMTVYICNRDNCFNRYIKDMKDDKLLLYNIYQESIVNR